VGGDTYNVFKNSYRAGATFDTAIPMDEAVMEYITSVLGGVISAETYAEPQGRTTQILE
jgi:5'-nucleotidase